MAESSPAIENLFSEGRTFPPPDEFKADALVTDRSLYEQAEQDLEGFWAEQAERLHWTKPWDQVLEWELPFAKWFVGGQLNVSDNCLDRHVEAGGGRSYAHSRRSVFHSVRPPAIVPGAGPAEHHPVR